MIGWLDDLSTIVLVGIIISVVLFWYQKQVKKILANVRFLDRRRRLSTVETPPRSLTPEKGHREAGPIAASSSYTEAFPPSGRENLVKLLQNAGSFLNEIEFRKNLIPFTSNYKECGPSTYTPTGISLGEVKTLGDFPDYATLADVPLPGAYEGFRLEKAIARPYRPFRWAYHQTMCMPNPYFLLELRLTRAKL